MKQMPKSKFRKLFTKYFRNRAEVDEIELEDFIRDVFSKEADDYFLNDRREWQRQEIESE